MLEINKLQIAFGEKNKFPINSYNYLKKNSKKLDYFKKEKV